MVATETVYEYGKNFQKTRKNHKKLPCPGLGRSVCLLVTLMLCLYVLEICREVIQKHPEEDTGWYLWLLFKTVVALTLPVICM